MLAVVAKRAVALSPSAAALRGLAAVAPSQAAAAPMGKADAAPPSPPKAAPRQQGRAPQGPAPPSNEPVKNYANTDASVKRSGVLQNLFH